jgi:hypothetical protein
MVTWVASVVHAQVGRGSGFQPSPWKSACPTLTQRNNMHMNYPSCMDGLFEGSAKSLRKANPLAFWPLTIIPQ